MAYTENEIYYPYDYDASADVPEDMKKMAESVDEIVGEIKGTQATQNNRLSTLETGQTSQGTRITNLETDNATNKTNIQTNKTNITNLQSENTRLKKNQIYGTATGKEVEITDGAEIGASIGVGGESEQETRSGKNKANIDEYYTPAFYPDVNVSLNNGEFNISTNSATNITEYTKIPLTGLKNGTSYTFGIDLKAGTQGCMARTLVYDNTNSKVVGGYFTNETTNYVSKTQKITIDDTIDVNNTFILLYCVYDGTVGNSYSSAYKNIFFNEGTDTTYEQYGAMPSPEFPSEIKNLTGDTVCTVRGKNLWNSELEIAEYDVNGNKTTTSVWLVNQVPINVKPNTQYTISQAEKPSQYRIICFKDYNYLSRINNTQNTSSGYVSYTFTTPANCNKIFIQFRSTLEVIATGSYDMSTTSITEVQLEKGTKTDYEPNQETSVTFPFGEQKLAKGDYLASDGIHHEKGQIILTGTENWVRSSDNLFQISGIVFPSNVALRTENTKAYSNMYKYAYYSSNITTNLQNNEFSWSGAKVFAIRDNNYSTATDWKIHLAELYANGTPVIVEYELAEPTTAPYTQAQQTAYNNLQNLILFEGYNYIEMTSPNGVKANLTVDYTKSTKIVIQNLDERIQALENAILEV